MEKIKTEQEVENIKNPEQVREDIMNHINNLIDEIKKEDNEGPMFVQNALLERVEKTVKDLDVKKLIDSMFNI